jgi:hypothetical protein
MYDTALSEFGLNCLCVAFHHPRNRRRIGMSDVSEAAGFTMVDGVEDAAQLAKLVAVIHRAQEVLVLDFITALVVFAGFGLLGELDLRSCSLSIFLAQPVETRHQTIILRSRVRRTRSWSPALQRSAA